MLTKPNTERYLPDWNKILNSKYYKLVILVRNIVINFSCFVRGVCSHFSSKEEKRVQKLYLSLVSGNFNTWT